MESEAKLGREWFQVRLTMQSTPMVRLGARRG